MRVAGKRFWTWMSVWMVSFFFKGELSASPRQDPKTQDPTTTSSHKHKVPSGPHAQYVKKEGSLKTSSGPSMFTPKKEGSLKTDYTRHKTRSGGGDDMPTESLKTVKTHGHKAPKPMTGKRQH